MPDIDFASFNPKSFEQFSQALAACVFGQGLMVFGEGPDGGREATFVGEVPYPGPVERWTGRLLLQAKFKQRPFRDRRDADWLVEQLESEAERIAAIGEIPDHYVLATNIRLSGVLGRERKGGQQKLDEAFERLLRPLGVGTLHVWHEEKIATLLDLHPVLMRSYGAWLAPREVLAAAFASLEDRVPDFGATMLRFLQRELRDQRATRLQQAGHVDDDPTPLESVFVDLPFGMTTDRRGEWARTARDADRDGQPGGLLADLLVVLSTKLDPSTLAATWMESYGPPPVRHLVLGGPGQGKSTVTQFLAQVARVRLLLDQPTHLLTPEARPIVEAVRRRMDELGLPIDGVRRYPVRVELPEFADALARAAVEGSRLSLLEFLVLRIARVATAPTLDVAALRRWLKAYPWLLVLDGLDEVPSSGNRAEVLAAVEDFWDEATPLGADVAMVITSRPQGYNDDLDPRLHARIEMSRLDAPRALEYAGRVASLKIGDEERRRRVIARLEAAAANQTTALLMTSPLQVAILLHLVDQRGTAPTDRWTLFAEYLSIVTKREQEKHGEIGRIVREHSFVVDGILRRAGLLLHLESEKRGAADAFLTTERFDELARGLLREDGHEGGDLDRLVSDIGSAVTNRLVFLEQRVEGRIEFDVRSLQEFMAAAELMEGEDGRIADRLHAIAGPTHWQHVYRIAASKAFSIRDAAKYRDAVITANTVAESQGLGARAVRRGGGLALELLADGVAHDQPKYRRMLLDQALSLLDLDPAEPDPRLLDVVLVAGPQIASPLLERRLSGQDERARRATWSLLVSCVNVPEGWADRLVAARWPKDVAGRLEVVTTGVTPAPGSAAARLMGEAVDGAPLALVSEAVHRAARRGRDVVDIGSSSRRPIMTTFAAQRTKGMFDVGVLQRRDPTMRLRILSIEGGRHVGLLRRPSTPGWASLDAVRAFVEDPSVLRLADHARSLGRSEVLDAAQRIAAPWIVATTTAMVTHGADPEALATEIAAGRFGGEQDWTGAERRWQKDGVTDADLEFWRRGEFFGSDVAERGAPYASHLSMSLGPGRNWTPEVEKLVAALSAAPASAPAEQLRRIVVFALTGHWFDGRMRAADFVRLLLVPRSKDRLFATQLVAALIADQRLDPELLEHLASMGREGGFLVGPDDPRLDVDVVARMVVASDDFGMLNFACAAFASKPALLREVAVALAEVLDGALPAIDITPSASVLGFAAGRVSVADALDASFAAGTETMEQHALLSLAGDPATSEADSETLLASLVERSGVNVFDLRSEAALSLNGLLDRRGSGIETGSEWARLGLPQALHSLLRSSRDAVD